MSLSEYTFKDVYVGITLRRRDINPVEEHNANFLYESWNPRPGDLVVQREKPFSFDDKNSLGTIISVDDSNSKCVVLWSKTRKERVLKITSIPVVSTTYKLKARWKVNTKSVCYNAVEELENIVNSIK